MIKTNIQVYSEIGKLKKVILHRPGKELENLMPEHLERLLFDEIPFLKAAQYEHEKFAETFMNNGVEVVYLEDMVSEAIKGDGVKEQFIDEIIREGRVDTKNIEEVRAYLNSMKENEVVEKAMAGIRKKEIGLKESYGEYPLSMDPMPNLYFTRDPFACIGSGVAFNSMYAETRRRETIFGKYIFEKNNKYKIGEDKYLYRRNEIENIEGGDILILSEKVLAIGSSQRTDKKAIQKLAESLFEKEESFNTVLIFEIPKKRAFMHLDTVFTMVDHDKFTVHPAIEATLEVTVIKKEEDGSISTKNDRDCLEKILSEYLEIDAKLIKCGNDDVVAASREQWSDGSNTLAIEPGKVITYERNIVTNEVLDKHGIEVLTIPSGELSRGRGGPRCMSMPLIREGL